MKPTQALNAHPILLENPATNTGKIRYLHPKKVKKAKVKKEVAKPANGSADSLNALAKTYPFCFHYRGKDNDTL
jgi:hypothetical protein